MPGSVWKNKFAADFVRKFLSEFFPDKKILTFLSGLCLRLVFREANIACGLAVFSNEDTDTRCRHVAIKSLKQQLVPNPNLSFTGSLYSEEQLNCDLKQEEPCVRICGNSCVTRLCLC